MDTSRRVWAHEEKDTARRFVLVATTNEEEFLPHDPALQRRLVVVRCGYDTPINPFEDLLQPFIGDNREQLWAEALAMYKGGERANPCRRIKNLAKEIGIKSIEIDEPFDNHLDDYLKTMAKDNWRRREITKEGKTMNEIVKDIPALERELNGRWFKNRFGRALRIKGFEKTTGRKPGGPVQKLWKYTGDLSEYIEQDNLSDEYDPLS